MDAKDDSFSDPYYGKDPQAIMKFYYNFKTQEDLVEWMRTRPMEAKCNVVELDGDTDIVVIVITLDSGNDLSKECKRIFEGQKMIFFESANHLHDRNFKYARVGNEALQYALKYNPKWIIISNDDVYKIDDFSVLKSKMNSLDNTKIDAVFTNKPNARHSQPLWFVKRNPIYKRYQRFRDGNKGQLARDVMDRFDVQFGYFPENSISFPRKLLHKLLYREIRRFYNTGNISMLSANFVRDNKKVFDDTFINSVEDVDLSMRLSKERSAFVDYKLGDYVGKTLASDDIRAARAMANDMYFDYKAKRNMIK